MDKPKMIRVTSPDGRTSLYFPLIQQEDGSWTLSECGKREAKLTAERAYDVAETLENSPRGTEKFRGR